jgi:hypothetical protein
MWVVGAGVGLEQVCQRHSYRVDQGRRPRIAGAADDGFIG